MKRHVVSTLYLGRPPIFVSDFPRSDGELVVGLPLTLNLALWHFRSVATSEYSARVLGVEVRSHRPIAVGVEFSPAPGSAKR